MRSKNQRRLDQLQKRSMPDRGPAVFLQLSDGTYADGKTEAAIDQALAEGRQVVCFFPATAEDVR
ncbi:hypothetical protein JYT20_01090 [Rhodothermus sp. AH-315-K08]|nr:hypothetical protein [Rhodothermus sp. AH-315-K08]